MAIPRFPARLAESLGLRFTSFHLPAHWRRRGCGTGKRVDRNALCCHWAWAQKSCSLKQPRRNFIARTAMKVSRCARSGPKLGLVPATAAKTTMEALSPPSRITTHVFASFGDDPRMKAILEVSHFQRAGGFHGSRAGDWLGDRRRADSCINEIRAGESGSLWHRRNRFSRI